MSLPSASDVGAITPILLFIRDALSTIISPLGWDLSTAETPFWKFHALAKSGNGGKCIVSWNGDQPIDQAVRAIVIRASIVITITATKDLFSPAPARLETDSARLYQVHDRIKGAMLNLSLPEATVPEPGAEVPVYAGSAPLVSPDGVPLDAIEQTWSVALLESFSPEYAPDVET